MTFKPTRPTHILSYKDMDNGRRTEVGCAYYNEQYKSFTVRLNPGVVLSYADMRDGDMKLRLFPNVPYAERMSDDHKGREGQEDCGQEDSEGGEASPGIYGVAKDIADAGSVSDI